VHIVFTGVSLLWLVILDIEELTAVSLVLLIKVR
jgi:hypothetical protein